MVNKSKNKLIISRYIFTDIWIALTGRVCEFDSNPNSLKAYEDFLEYDEDNMKAYVRVRFRNAPMFLPFEENRLYIEISDSEDALVKYRFESKLKIIGYLLYPIVRLALGVFTSQIIEELVFYSETGQPHPRKLKKSAKINGKKKAQTI